MIAEHPRTCRNFLMAHSPAPRARVSFVDCASLTRIRRSTDTRPAHHFKAPPAPFEALAQAVSRPINTGYSTRSSTRRRSSPLTVVPWGSLACATGASELVTCARLRASRCVVLAPAHAANAFGVCTRCNPCPVRDSGDEIQGDDHPKYKCPSAY